MKTTTKNEGTVSEITIFYTKLATIDNKIILLPNGSLADISITNVTNEDNRRVELKVGISYRADIRKAKAVINSLIEANDRIIKDKEYRIFVDDLGSQLRGDRHAFLDEDRRLLAGAVGYAGRD